MRTLTSPSDSSTRANGIQTEVAPLQATWIQRCWRMIRHGSNRFAPQVATPFWDRDSAYMLAVAALRQKEFALAEFELTRGDGDRAVNDARCLNLLGIVHECRGNYGRARWCFSRAARLDKSLVAPRVNLRRWYELTTFGKTEIRIALGDETEKRS